MKGFCQQWGCILPVGGGSMYGPGPVCMVCKLKLRPSAVPPELVRREVLRALSDTEELLDAYSWDHNSTSPTDPTIVLPLVRRALALVKLEEEDETEARESARPGRGER